MVFRTDKHRNPTAFTTDIAKNAGLVEGVDYVVGDSFHVGDHEYFTATILGDILQKTVKVIDTIGFYTKGGQQRWTYIGVPKFIWDSLNVEQKIKVIGFMYQHEGGTEMKSLFA